MIEAIANAISKRQAHHPWRFVIAFIVITALIAPGIMLLAGNIEPSFERVLPRGVPAVELLDEIRTDFGADLLIVLFEVRMPVESLRDPEALGYVQSLALGLEDREGIVSVASFADDPSLLDASARRGAMLVQVDTGADPERIGSVLDTIEAEIELLETRNPGLSASITGNPSIDRATFRIIMSDFARITGLAFALIIAVILLIFRSARALLPLTIVMVGVIWTMGLTGYLGLEITVVSMVSAAMVMGLGIDFGIHVYHGYRDRRRHYGPDRSARETLQELLRAMLGASLTTSAGFLALLFGVLPAMKVLAIMLSIGIISTMLAAALLLLPILMITDRGTRQ